MYTPPSSNFWNTFFSVMTSLNAILPPRSTHIKLPLTVSPHCQRLWIYACFS